MCMSNLGPRMMATWACILECLYSANGCTNKMECKKCTNICNRDFSPVLIPPTMTNDAYDQAIHL